MKVIGKTSRKRHLVVLSLTLEDGEAIEFLDFFLHQCGAEFL